MEQALAEGVKLAGRVRLDAQALKARRAQLGMSQEAFARACAERHLRVSIASVKRAETGKSVLLRTARHLAVFHGLPLQTLLRSCADGIAALADQAEDIPDRRDSPDDGVGAQMPLRHIELVGRQQELRLFDSLLHGVVAGQQSQVITVQGVPGIGKSRLLMEMATIAKARFFCTATVELPKGTRDGHRAAMAACLKALLGLQERTPFWAQLVAQRLTHCGLTAKQMLICRDALGVALRGEERGLMQAMCDAERQGAMAQAVSGIVSRMASRRPLVMMVEDIDQATPGALELLSRALSSTQASPVMWVFSARLDASAGRRHPPLPAPDVACLSLTLPPLRQSEALALCQQFPQVSAEWRECCMRRAQGHPLILTQLLAAQDHEQRSPLPAALAIPRPGFTASEGIHAGAAGANTSSQTGVIASPVFSPA